jgi:diamine N-acetyltransferase
VDLQWYQETGPIDRGGVLPSRSTRGQVPSERLAVLRSSADSSPTVARVDLVPITLDNWRAAAAVRASEDQLRFVGGQEPVALAILSKGLARSDGLDWWPYLVTDGDLPVGVLALVDGRQRDGQLALSHLLVDADHQRRGHGRATLRLVVELARQVEGCRRLRLTVHPDNTAAVGLYLAEGFSQDGVDEDGELRLSVSTS